MDTIYIWGIKFNPLRKLEIVAWVQQWLKEGRKGIHITGVNPEGVVQAQQNTLLREAINGSDLVNIDNMLVTLSLRFCGYRVPERAATPDVFELLLQEADRRKQKIYLLGAEESVLQCMVRKIEVDYPNICISGFHNGYYPESEEARIVEDISRFAPDFLFLGLPTPQKETFILRYKRQLPVGCFYGIGGAFDVKGGKVSRAPNWLRRVGLEGFCRVLQNPKNYGSRITTYYSSFLKLVWKEYMKKRK